jgi:hypothetical protein
VYWTPRYYAAGDEQGEGPVSAAIEVNFQRIGDYLVYINNFVCHNAHASYIQDATIRTLGNTRLFNRAFP